MGLDRLGFGVLKKCPALQGQLPEVEAADDKAETCPVTRRDPVEEAGLGRIHFLRLQLKRGTGCYAEASQSPWGAKKIQAHMAGAGTYWCRRAVPLAGWHAVLCLIRESGVRRTLTPVTKGEGDCVVQVQSGLVAI